MSGIRFLYPFSPIAGDKVISYPHPVFSLETDLLINLGAKVMTGELSEQEAILTFLALFDRLGTVKFDIPARLDYLNARSNIESLIRTHKIIGHMYRRNKATLLPGYVVSVDSCTLSNVGTYLQDVIDALNAEGEAIEEADNAIASLWDRILAGIYSTQAQKAAYIHNYVKRILESDTLVSRLRHNIPNPARKTKTTRIQLWLDIIKADATTAYLFDEEDIADLETYLVNKLGLRQSGTSQSKVIFDHLKAIRATKAFDAYTIDDLLSPPVKHALDAVDDIEIIDTGVALTLSEKVAAMGSRDDKPTRWEFKTEIEYLKAVAAWNLAQSKKKRSAQ